MAKPLSTAKQRVLEYLKRTDGATASKFTTDDLQALLAPLVPLTAMGPD